MLSASLAARWTLAYEGAHATTQARRASLICAVVLSLSYGFVALAIDARVDMTLCWCVMIALYFPLRSLASTPLASGSLAPTPPGARSLRYFWLCCGFAVLAKGPLGMVLPLFILCPILIDLFGFRRGLGMVLLQPRGWLYCCAVALPWYLIAIDQGGLAFVERQLIFENLQRFAGGDFVNKEKWWFYFPSFLSTCAPWSLIVMYQAVAALFSRKASALGLGQNPYLRITLLWILVPVILLSIASGKRHSYLLPLLPAVALLCSQVKISNQLKNKAPKLLARISRIICGLLCVSALAFYPIALVDLHDNAVYSAVQDFLAAQAHYAQIIFGLSAFFLVLFWDRPRAALTWVASLTLVVGWLSIGIGIKNHLKGFDRIAAAINKSVPATTPIYLPKHPRDEFFDPLLYYLDRSVALIEESSDPCAMNGYIIASRAWLYNLDASKNACMSEIFFARTIPDQQKVRAAREIVLLQRKVELPSYAQ